MSRRAAVSARYSLGTISRRAVNFHFYREARGVARALARRRKTEEAPNEIIELTSDVYMEV